MALNNKENHHWFAKKPIGLWKLFSTFLTVWKQVLPFWVKNKELHTLPDINTINSLMHHYSSYYKSIHLKRDALWCYVVYIRNWFALLKTCNSRGLSEIRDAIPFTFQWCSQPCWVVLRITAHLHLKQLALKHKLPGLKDTFTQAVCVLHVLCGSLPMGGHHVERIYCGFSHRVSFLPHILVNLVLLAAPFDLALPINKTFGFLLVNHHMRIMLQYLFHITAHRQ